MPSVLPRRFTLQRPVPMCARYANCVVVAEQLRFYADVCGQDESLRRPLFGR